MTTPIGKPTGRALLNSLKTECCHGHPLTDCYRFTDTNGYAHRQCRTCIQLRFHPNKKRDDLDTPTKSRKDTP